jgi:hypothetical protein
MAGSPIGTAGSVAERDAWPTDTESFLSFLLNRRSHSVCSIHDSPWADLDYEPGGTPLHIATIRGDIAAIKVLIENGADVNALDVENQSPLTLAARRGLVDVAQLLLDAGACIEHRDRRGYTPLMPAAWEGQLSIVELLHRRGANTCMGPYRQKYP